MKNSVFTITKNNKLTSNVYIMTLKGDTEGIRCGQFVNIRLDGLYLRRPISVCDCEGDLLTLIYKVVGKGTEQMSEMAEGESNGYDLTKSGDAPLLIGGGVGVPPMYMLCRELIREGKKPTVILGFKKADEVFYKNEFEALGARVLVATADGSMGIKGFVTNAMDGLDYSYFYTCGPEPMLRAVYKASATSGQFSFEERMGCGFGACMGCSCKTITGYKRICKEGPVLEKEEILF